MTGSHEVVGSIPIGSTFGFAALLVACAAKDGAQSSGDAGTELPPSTATVAPLDPSLLAEGNLALSCSTGDVDARVDALLAQMTLEQKVAEMHGLEGAPADGLYTAGGDATLGIPPFKMVDGPRGVRAGNATAFPVAMARGATWDPELERRVGLAIGRETAAKGGNVLLAPTVNLLRHPGWGRAQETYSEDPFHMGVMASGFIGGAQNQVLSSAKHFAVNSVENTRFTMSANLDERTLREVYLPHFRRAVEEARVASVMSAYNRVNGIYCAENAHLLSDILKGDWGFEGFVESDWFAGVRSTVPSALAGLDIEMPVASFYGAPLVSAVQNGELAETVIDGAVRRILRQKLCFGLDAPPPADPAAVESPEHVALALEVAEKAIVLLKNADDVLPLAATSRRIALVGVLAGEANLGDHGSSSVTPTRAVSPLDGIRAVAPGVEVISVLTDEPSDADLDPIAATDVAIVVLGLTYRDEGEFIPIPQEIEGLAPGGDRADLKLADLQEQLVARVAARAQKTVVVLEGGSAITVRNWVDSVDALLMAWYPGMEGGTGIARVLFGMVNPSGKLPVTFPRSMEQLPPWDITSDEVLYGYFHGYRLVDRNGEEPEFPFGFGLSYTRFALGRLAVDRAVATRDDVVTVSVDVYNEGSRAGDEVVQVYVSYPDSGMERSVSELRAFRRISLEPGEVKTVELELPVNDLAYYDEASATWVVEPGEYVLRGGTSSRDLPLTGTLRVD